MWNDHIFGIAKDAARCLGFLYRWKLYFTPSDLLNIYKAYIRPKLEYNSHIWAGASQTSLNYLDKIQKRAIRLINDETVTNSLAPLEHRRIVGALSLYYRYLVGVGTCSTEIRHLMPPLKLFPRNTRGASSAHPYFMEISRWYKSGYGNSFIVRTSKMWNKIPPHVFPNKLSHYTYNLHIFKKNINTFLLNIPPTLLPSFFI
jgi:hypothetical protein